MKYVFPARFKLAKSADFGVRGAMTKRARLAAEECMPAEVLPGLSDL